MTLGFGPKVIYHRTPSAPRCILPKPIPVEKWDLICRTYLDLKSIRATARTVGMGKTSVEYVLKSRGVPRFPRNRSGAENSSVKAILASPDSPSAKVRNTALMDEMYVHQKKSIQEIADALGVSARTVCTGLRFCGIPSRSVSAALRGKARPSIKGPRNPAWKGGITKWRKLARAGLNSCFVRPVMEQDDFRCQWCGSTKKPVVHHLRPFMEIVNLVRSRNPGADNDDLIREIIDEHTLEDGVTLCKRCHDKHHEENGK